MNMFTRTLAALAVISMMIGMVTAEEEVPNYLGVSVLHRHYYHWVATTSGIGEDVYDLW